MISSIYAFVNGVGAMPYAMSKAAVEQLGRALRVELAPHGASASVAYFGFIDTEMVHRRSTPTRSPSGCSRRCPKPLHKRLAPAGRGRGDRARDRAAQAADHPAAPLDDPVRAARHPRPARATRSSSATPTTQAIARELDARDGEEQPTTA